MIKDFHISCLYEFDCSSYYYYLSLCRHYYVFIEDFSNLFLQPLRFRLLFYQLCELLMFFHTIPHFFFIPLFYFILLGHIFYPLFSSLLHPFCLIYYQNQLCPCQIIKQSQHHLFLISFFCFIQVLVHQTLYFTTCLLV